MALTVSLMLAAVFLSGCAGLPRKDLQLQREWVLSLPQDYSGLDPEPSRYLEQALEMPDKHGTVLLNTGDDALLARLHLIGAAQHQIDIQTFIWRDDHVTRAIFKEIERAARRGVRVRILVDALNRIGDPEVIAAMAGAHRNIEIALHRPLSSRIDINRINWVENLFLKMRRLNRRMHNKIFIVDGLVGIVGGRNYEDKYYDRSPEMIFRDRDVLVTGPTVRDMEMMFEAYWNHRDSVFAGQFKDVAKAHNNGHSAELTGVADLADLLRVAQESDLSRVRPQLNWRSVAAAVFSWDKPGKLYNKHDDDRPTLGIEIYNMMLAAQEEILIQTPYLIYQRKTARELKGLKKSNKGMTIRISSNSLASADHVSVYAISFKHRQKFYKSMGLEVHEFKPNPDDRAKLAFIPEGQAQVKMAIHAKSLVVDGKAAKVGSHNFDPRSNNLNTECGLIVIDDDFAADVRAAILKDMAPGNSWVVGRKLEKDSWFNRGNRLVGDVSNMIPFLDIWPYRYTSNFALKDGMEPLPNTRHPEFYRRYVDVGQFPGVDSLSEVFQTQIYKIFVGWARPFM